MWASTVASQIGSFIQIVATSWAMASLTASAAMVALVQTAANLPVMLFAILAGALADLHERRSVMLTAQLLMLLMAAALSICAATGNLTPALLLGFTFLIGCGAALHGPAWQASVGDLVPREDIPAAVAANIVGNNVARSIGPAAGGAVVSIFGVTFAFFLNTFSYLGIIAVLWRWKGRRPRPPVERGFAQVLLSGLQYGFGRRHERRVFARALLFSMGAAAIWGLMPMVAIRLGGGADLLGLLFGSFGVGGMLGAVVSHFVRGRRGAELVARLGTAAIAAASLVLGLSHSVPLALLAHLVAGAGWVAGLSTFNVSIQLAVPRHFVGRVLAIYQTTAFGGLALGSALWGIVGDGFGIGAALTAAGCFSVLGSVLGARLGLPPPAEPHENGGEALSPASPIASS